MGAVDVNEALLKQRASLRRRLYPSLATWEITLWTGIWVFVTGYSVYNVYLISMRYWKALDVTYLEPGYWAASRKDVSDDEWEVFSTIAVRSFAWLGLHSFGTQYFKKFNPEMLPIFHFLLPMIYISQELGKWVLAFLFIQPIVIFTVAQIIPHILAVWGAALVFMVTLEMPYVGDFTNYMLSNSSTDEKYMAHVVMFWINSRCVSFCMDHIWGAIDNSHEISSFRKFTNLISYCFYLPTSMMGPLINYKDYHQGVNNVYVPWTVDRVKKYAALIVRYFVWYGVIELALHFVYVSALRFEPELVKKMNMWTISGLGFTFGQFFCLKYVFFYGITRPFVMMDGIEPPNHPKCIARIHLYSDMWRYFDEGLYKFMHRYIYEPLVSKTSKNVLKQIFASAVCFSFVYIWHGIAPQVRVWSVLNYIGIILETTARSLSLNPTYLQLERSFLSPRGQRRLYACVSAPLFLLSIVSNMFFLLGYKNGWTFMVRGFLTWPIGTPTTLFFMYCGAQTSIEIKNWEIRKKLANLENITH